MKWRTRNSSNSKRVLKPKSLQPQRSVLLMPGAWISVSGQQWEQRGAKGKQKRRRERDHPPKNTPEEDESSSHSPSHLTSLLPSSPETCQEPGSPPAAATSASDAAPHPSTPARCGENGTQGILKICQNKLNTSLTFFFLHTQKSLETETWGRKIPKPAGVTDTK